MEKLKKKEMFFNSAVADIYKLTDEFIDSFNELADKLNLKHPYELYVLYCYLYKSGFLSVDGTYDFSPRECDEYYDLRHNGYLVFLGIGVCRHLSPLLRDIYRSRNFESYDMAVTVKAEDEVKIGRSPIETFTDEEREEFITNKFKNDMLTQMKLRDEIKTLDDDYKKHIQFISSGKKEFNLQEEFVGNHEICTVIDNGYMYYLDPTNYTTYSRKGHILTSDEISVSIKNIGTVFYEMNPNTKIDTIKYLTKDYPTISKTNEKLMRSYIENLCDNNQDLFLDFYFDNHHIYEKVTDRARVIKK